MASAARPTLLRQACMASSTRRLFTTRAANVPHPTSLLSSRTGLLQSTSHPSRVDFVKYSMPGTMRIAAFHASGQKALLPPLPQRVEGTANDAAVVPDPHPMHGSYHWTFERVISAGLVPLTIAPFAAGSLNPVMDATLCALLLIHTHMGFQSVVIDYIPTKRLPNARKLFDYGLYAATLLVGYGMYEFETNDVGITEAIKRIWTAGRAPAAEAAS